MTIKTKYNIQDEVYVIFDNNITKGIVKGIDTINRLEGLNETKIKYILYYAEGSTSCQIANCTFEEKNVFKNKKELLKTI